MMPIEKEKQEKFNHTVKEIQKYITFLVNTNQYKGNKAIQEASKELSLLIETAILSWDDKK